MMAAALSTPDYRLGINLEMQTVELPTGEQLPFEVDASAKRRLQEGLDDIAITLQSADLIRAYEAFRRKLEPWLFEDAVQG
jgi:3-isopropylmalate/(R)-2-methylmalate dehydratase small subunit